jgi:tetraacyldisaccharide 4'-kinase
VLWFRNKFYDWGILKSVSPVLPSISIGNITVGGTGKTPHTELILRLLNLNNPIAVLSAGYRRSSKGFRYVGTNDSAVEVGDEPLQIKRKFPSTVVAVGANRIAAIKQMAQDHPNIKLVVLDDAFQYRKLKPTYSILLSDYHRPYTQDLLLPFGRLRDLPAQARRANMIVITKCPSTLSPEDRQKQQHTLRLKLHQKLIFTTLHYNDPRPLFHLESLPDYREVISITGIAQPKPFLNHLAKYGVMVYHFSFPDHHIFTQKEVKQINFILSQHPKAILFTTEKDAVRLLETPNLSQEVKKKLYYVPVTITFCSKEDCNQFMNIPIAFQFPPTI